MRSAFAMCSAFLLSFPAASDVTWQKESGFESVNVAEVAPTPGDVWQHLVKPETWWHDDHNWSDKSANLSLDPVAGGCFCETLPGGGSVEHLRVTFAKPGDTLRLRGGLGPLQEHAITGAQTWKLEATESGGTKITLTYRVTGTLEGSVADWAGAVDYVHGEQLTRLARLVNTGSPDPAE